MHRVWRLLERGSACHHLCQSLTLLPPCPCTISIHRRAWASWPKGRRQRVVSPASLTQASSHQANSSGGSMRENGSIATTVPGHQLTPQALLEVARAAAQAGANVIKERLRTPLRATLSKPQWKACKPNVLAAETEAASREAILKVLSSRFPQHPVLSAATALLPGGQEIDPGKFQGDASQGYLWCVDALNGVTNFAHEYPFFAVSVGVLAGPEPVAGCVIEFCGGPGTLVTLEYAAARGWGATRNGQRIHVSEANTLEQSLVSTSAHSDVALTEQESFNLFKHFTDRARGVRKLGATAVDLCHVACGSVDASWDFMAPPWQTCAGVLLVTEAGGTVTTMAGGRFSPFHRSMLASNGPLHGVMLDSTVKSRADHLWLKMLTPLHPTLIPPGYDAGFAAEDVTVAARQKEEREKEIRDRRAAGEEEMQTRGWEEEQAGVQGRKGPVARKVAGGADGGKGGKGPERGSAAAVASGGRRRLWRDGSADLL